MSDCGMPLLPEIVTHVFEINYSTYGNLAPFVIECIERLGGFFGLVKKKFVDGVGLLLCSFLSLHLGGYKEFDERSFSLFSYSIFFHVMLDVDVKGRTNGIMM